MSQHERKLIAVHPNSMAAKKWKRKTWYSTRHLFVEAAESRRLGNVARADALVRAAARASRTQHHCG